MGLTAENLPQPNSPALQSRGGGRPVQLWMPSKHMGNLLVSLKAIESLIRFYGRDRCQLVIDETYRQIMDCAELGVPVIYFPRKAIDRAGIGGKLVKTSGFIARIRRSKPVIGIAIEGDKVSQKFLPLSGGRFAVGPDNKYCRHYRLRLPLNHDGGHVFRDYEAVSRQLSGEPLSPGYVALNGTAQARRQVRQRLATDLPHPGRPYAVLHPCATKDYKQWPVEHFAQLADYLSRRGVNPVITGAGEFDRLTIERLQTLVAQPVLNLHNQLSLAQLVALMEDARFFIGNDTGPTHLAAASGAPTFAIFGPTDETLWGPLGDRARVLRSAVACERDCLRRRCAVNYRCMRTLTNEEVIDAVKGLL